MAIVFAISVVVLALSLAFVTRRPKTQNQARYEAVPEFLSAAERSFFGVLQQAVSADFIIFAKVRMADIVQPMKNPSRSGWQTAFNRISSKHVDFVLCDPSRLTVVLAIELDDRSHSSRERSLRDNLVDSALADARIPILRVPARHSYAPLQLRDQINTVLGRSAEALSAESRSLNSDLSRCHG